MNDATHFSRYLSLACLILLGLFVAFGQALKPAVTPPQEPQIDAQLVYLTPAPTHIRSSTPTPSIKPAIRTRPTPIHTQPKPAPAPKINVPPSSNKIITTPQATAAPVPVAPPASAVAPVPNHDSTTQQGTEQQGAYAIVHPKPVIPDALQDRAIHIVVKVQFTIAEDGTASIKMLKSASDPRLNQAIMNALSQWRFMPAMQEGKPISSLLDMNIPIDVDN